MGASQGTVQSTNLITAQLHDGNLMKTTAQKQHVTAQLSPWQKFTSLKVNHIKPRKRAQEHMNVWESMQENENYNDLSPQL